MTFERVEHFTHTDVKRLIELFDKEWWTQGRTPQQVQTLLDSVSLTVCFRDSATGQIAAFACVMSDGVFRATIMDVIVAEGYRGQGLGVRVMQTILDEPSMVNIPRINLHCLDELLPFYERLGFEHLLNINVMKLGDR